LQPEGVNPENGTVQQNRIVRIGTANLGATSGIDINNADGTLSGDTVAPIGTRVISLDVDTGTGDVRVFLNGDLQGTGTGYTGNRVLHFIINGQTGAYEVYFNGGQQPFLYRPVDLDDSNSIQTQNLPAATIPNGRDHFQAITGPGSGADSSEPNAIIGAFSSTWTASGDGWGSKPPANAFSPDISDFLNNNTGGQTVTWDTSSFNLSGELTILQRASGDPYRMLVDGVEVIASITPGANGSQTDYTVTIDNPSSIVWEPAPGTQGGICIYNFQLDGDNLRDGNILALAQQAFPTGLWWIKDRDNSNEHQLVDSVRGGNLALQSPAAGRETAYVAPAGNSVAWCWNAGGAAVANTEGTMGGQIAANPAAGFSITTFDGVTAGGTYGHGLNDTPAMIIRKNRAADPTATGFFDFYVYHVGVPNGFLRLNKDNAAANSVIMTPGPTTVDCVGATATNNDGVPLVAYNFAPVPGYSAFGSYTAVNNGDKNPFVYLGFRPAFLLIKATNSNYSWLIQDSTRNPANPANLDLYSNTTAGENSARNQIDFLSNGFKLRSSYAESGSNNTYVYAAFAENPAGGLNVSPANAR
jgi:hypothetical protein